MTPRAIVVTPDRAGMEELNAGRIRGQGGGGLGRKPRHRPRAGNFLELADETWLDGFALKFFGAVRLTRLFWPLLKAAQGHLVSIIGGAARTVEPEFLIGGSVNAAAANFSKGLSRLGMRDGVHVNAIHPGQTATERTEQLVR